jgi:hypothetical protein
MKDHFAGGSPHHQQETSPSSQEMKLAIILSRSVADFS